MSTRTFGYILTISVMLCVGISIRDNSLAQNWLIPSIYLLMGITLILRSKRDG